MVMKLAGLVLGLIPIAAFAQSALSVKWEELTAADFVSAIQKSQGRACCPSAFLKSTGLTSRWAPT